MSTVVTETPPPVGWDRNRGTWGAWIFIASETALFGVLFFAYSYLGRDAPRWPPDPPPRLLPALVMMALLIAGSGALEWGRESLLVRRRTADGRAALGTAMALGAAFLVLQALEYRDHLRIVTPTTDAYGSIFYTITTIHGAHVLLGVLVLAYVLVLPQLEPTERPPYRPYHTATLYWHFVVAVWIVIVAILYVLPHVS